MPARRLRFRPAVSAIALLLAVFGTQQAHAGLFDDEEARRQINDLTIKVNERVDTLSKAQIELVNQIQALREENAKLRGQVETLQYELESAKKSGNKIAYQFKELTDDYCFFIIITTISRN